MSKRTVWSFMGLAVYAVILVSGCAAPPTEAMSAAEQAIQDARAGEAEHYAMDAFQKAVDQFDVAQKHMAAEEYAEARTAAEKTIELAAAAGKETGVGRELMKVDAETKLADFLASWTEISAQLEKGRGKDALALAKEAGEFSQTISESLNELKDGEKWYELLAALEEADMKAKDFQARMGAK